MLVFEWELDSLACVRWLTISYRIGPYRASISLDRSHNHEIIDLPQIEKWLREEISRQAVRQAAGE